MRRITLFVLLLLSVGFAFAAEGSWTNDNSNVVGTDSNATMKVSFDLSSSGSGGTGSGDNEIIRVGFTSAAVSTFSADAPTAETTAKLETNSDGYGTLEEDRYIYWQIQSPNSLHITLSWDENMTTTEGDTLSWDVTTTKGGDTSANNGTAVGATNATYTGTVVLNRDVTSGDFYYGTVGSQQLSIKTGSVADAAIGTYTGTLTLTIAEGASTSN